MQVIIWFLFFYFNLTLRAVLKELYYWGQDFFLPILMARKLLCQHRPSQAWRHRHPNECMYLWNSVQIYLLPVYPWEEERNSQCSESEVEILPFPTLTSPLVLPRSPWTQAHNYFPWAHSDPVPLKGHSCLSISLIEMASDPLDVFPQMQLE